MQYFNLKQSAKNGENDLLRDIGLGTRPYIENKPKLCGYFKFTTCFDLA